MMLSRISPGPIGFEHRLFECPTCDFVQNEVVASDPMKSASVGWLAIAHLQEKLEQARRLLQQVSDPTTTESLKALIADLESRLSDLLEPE